MVDFVKAIERPFTDFKRFMLGLLFSIIPVVNFIALGYELECGRLASKRQFKLPEWKNYGRLFVKGLLQFCIALIYLLIPAILFLIWFFKALYPMINVLKDNVLLVQGSMQQQETLGLMLLQAVASSWELLLFVVVLLLLACYVMYSAIIKYAITNRFKDAFSFEVWRKAFTWKYFMIWFIGLVYYAVWLFLLSFIPFVGSGIAGFIGGVTLFTLLGEVYSEIK